MKSSVILAAANIPNHLKEVLCSRVRVGGSEHTMSDPRSSMAASTASSTVVAKELLNFGFGEGLDYLEGITIH